MPFFCPDCGGKLATSYMASKPITDIHHTSSKHCSGLGKIGKFGHEQSQKQKKVQDRLQGEAKSKAHKDHKSAKAINYQTPHKNTDVQQQRVKLAVSTGLGGHLSDTSNSKQNRNTSDGLKVINEATRK